MGGQLGCEIYLLRRLVGRYLGNENEWLNAITLIIKDPFSFFRFKGISYHHFISPVFNLISSLSQVNHSSGLGCHHHPHNNKINICIQIPVHSVSGVRKCSNTRLLRSSSNDVSIPSITTTIHIGSWTTEICNCKLYWYSNEASWLRKFTPRGRIEIGCWKWDHGTLSSSSSTENTNIQTFIKIVQWYSVELGMVTVTVYGYGRILYGQCTVTARHRTSPYHVGQLALPVQSRLYIRQSYGLLRVRVLMS